jgi:hypothetical protein
MACHRPCSDAVSVSRTEATLPALSAALSADAAERRTARRSSRARRPLFKKSLASLDDGSARAATEAFVDAIGVAEPQFAVNPGSESRHGSYGELDARSPTLLSAIESCPGFAGLEFFKAPWSTDFAQGAGMKRRLFEGRASAGARRALTTAPSKPSGDLKRSSSVHSNVAVAPAANGSER